ncbi:hypothetical protein MARA_51670 [Mycolicibacterium arabiense]|uniref:Uncharacterized protein n=1 Tax=Mycolicibacterium arabiense TaxID=1286181 RepID=A0A7I7S5X3_9MYCO|nr:hypothetical protein [Mycolicibacterium arabiense]BBY51699.1 hypothetical protein MARA_51670 [Mycolicibacterium arabiense]
MADRTSSSDGPSSDRTRIIRRRPDPLHADFAPQTGIIRRAPTGPLPVVAPPGRDDPQTTFITPPESQTTFIEPPDAHTFLRPPDDPQAAYPPRATPEVVLPRPSPGAASATATLAIISGWATAVIATSLITNWWRTDELFCIAIGFLTAVSAAATIGGLISLLLRRRIGRLLIGVGSIVALMIFAGLFVAGASLPAIVYAIPALPLATIVLAVLPATGRWCR